jgi:hypothetical protein
MVFLIAMHIPSWFFGAMLSDPTERGLVMTIMELAAITPDPWYCRCHYRHPRARPLRVRRQQPVYA